MRSLDASSGARSRVSHRSLRTFSPVSSTLPSVLPLRRRLNDAPRPADGRIWTQLLLRHEEAEESA